MSTNTTTMRAKFQLNSVTPIVSDGQTMQENLSFNAVSTKPYGPNGESEDNTYAKWTPAGQLSLSITNPALIGKFKQGQRFYLDFTEAE